MDPRTPTNIRKSQIELTDRTLLLATTHKNPFILYVTPLTMTSVLHFSKKISLEKWNSSQQTPVYFSSQNLDYPLFFANAQQLSMHSRNMNSSFKGYNTLSFCKLITNQFQFCSQKRTNQTTEYIISN